MRPPALSLALLFSLATASDLSADALVLTQAMKASTIAEISIEEDRIDVTLEIGIPGLDAFVNLLPDDLCEKLGHDDVAPWSERLPLFLAEDFRILAGGQPLPGRLVEIEGRPRVLRDEITGEPVPPAEGTEPEAVVAARLVYPLELDHKPATLSFIPPMGDKAGRPAANVGFIAYHRGIPINDFRYLGREEILDLDWEDPWYSKFRNRNLHRQFIAPIKGYIYVEPFEVRKEIVARVRDVENWIDLGLQDKKTIAAADQEAIKEKIAAFLAERCPLTIDGAPVELELDRIHFIKRTLRTTTVVDPPEDLPALTAMVGAIYIVRTGGFPQEVSMNWDLFTPRVQKMTGTTTDQAGSLPQEVAPGYPLLTWKNFLTNPVLPAFIELTPPPRAPRLPLPLLSLACSGIAFLLLFKGRKNPGAILSPGKKACAIAALVAAILCWPIARLSLPLPLAGSPPLTEKETGDLMTGLLKNIYHAFDYHRESAIYDTLERSVSGNLLQTVYLDVRGVLELQNQGGARAKVTALDLAEARAASIDGGPAFRADCTWTVTGSVGHWGHTHQRRNQYQAEITVEPVDHSWKITNLDLLEEKRL